MAEQRKGLSGYTTGTCAQAATKAAAVCLLTGRKETKVTVKLPGGQCITLQPELWDTEPNLVRRTVCKDEL